MDVQTALNISRTNALVRPQDRAAFDALAKQSQEELRSLRQSLAEANELTSFLKSKISETKRGLSVCRVLSAPSPIRSLPPELLALVFTFACTGDSLHVYDLDNNPPPTCIALVRVCKYWRELAFGTKAIWEHVVFIEHDGYYDAGEEAILQGVFELYGKHLTRVYLDWEYIEPINVDLFDLILDRQQQIVSFSIMNGDCFFSYRKTSNMPVLEELILSAGSNVYASDGELIKFNAPRLTKVFLYVPEFELTVNNPSLPWHQISHLSIGSPCTAGTVDQVSAIHFLDLLPQLGRLTSLHLTEISLEHGDGVDPDDGESDTQSVITHQHLKYLELYDPYLSLVGATDNVCLPPRISTPSLEVFDLFFRMGRHAGSHGWSGTVHNVLISFFQRTPSLHQVRLVLMSDNAIGIGRDCSSILQFTGKATFFTLLTQIITEHEDDNRFVEFGKERKVPKKDWLGRYDIWTDKLIDRFIDQFPIISAKSALPMERSPLFLEGGGASDECDRHNVGSDGEEEEDDSQSAHGDVEEHHYKAKDRRTLKAIFASLGDARIPNHIQRHVYLGF